MKIAQGSRNNCFTISLIVSIIAFLFLFFLFFVFFPWFGFSLFIYLLLLLLFSLSFHLRSPPITRFSESCPKQWIKKINFVVLFKLILAHTFSILRFMWFCNCLAFLSEIKIILVSWPGNFIKKMIIRQATQSFDNAFKKILISLRCTL